VSSAGDDVVGWSDDGVEQGDEADEGRLEAGRGIIVGCCTLGRHRGRLEKVAPFAAYPRCSTDVWRSRADGGVIPDDWARPGEVPLVVVPQLVAERGSMTRAALLMPFDATWSFMSVADR
jgi:hypothetical protein